MIQRGDRVYFSRETFAELLGGNLYGDVAPRARIAGAVDLSHSPEPSGSPTS
jgi:hypothetical protein